MILLAHQRCVCEAHICEASGRRSLSALLSQGAGDEGVREGSWEHESQRCNLTLADHPMVGFSRQQQSHHISWHVTVQRRCWNNNHALLEQQARADLYICANAQHMYPRCRGHLSSGCIDAQDGYVLQVAILTCGNAAATPAPAEQPVPAAVTGAAPPPLPL